MEPQTGISTGSIALDIAIGVGGLPRGRITEIYGPESSGKTTLALHVIASAQKLGGKCTFIDAEHALDPIYAAKLGVNTEELFVSQPSTGEQALEIADMLIKSHSMDVVVIDSVAALVPKAELEGDMGMPQMGAQARLMSQVFCVRMHMVCSFGLFVILRAVYIGAAEDHFQSGSLEYCPYFHQPDSQQDWCTVCAHTAFNFPSRVLTFSALGSATPRPPAAVTR